MNRLQVKQITTEKSKITYRKTQNIILFRVKAFLEGRLFSSQSELFEYFFNCSDWLDQSRIGWNYGIV